MNGMTPADVDEMFLERARTALSRVGISALEVLQASPQLSVVELAEHVGWGCSTRGLTMMIYAEALALGAVRGVARELLFRAIRDEFPTGWSSTGAIRPTVRIGSWYHGIRDSLDNGQAHQSAEAIMRDLAYGDAPSDGWCPSDSDNPLLQRLFDRHWLSCPSRR